MKSELEVTQYIFCQSRQTHPMIDDSVHHEAKSSIPNSMVNIAHLVDCFKPIHALPEGIVTFKDSRAKKGSGAERPGRRVRLLAEMHENAVLEEGIT